MPDYRRLADYLARQTEPRVTLAREQVEGIIGGPLPAAALVMTDWWDTGRVRRHGGRRDHDAPWHAAGWYPEHLDTYRGAVTFGREVAYPEG